MTTQLAGLPEIEESLAVRISDQLELVEAGLQKAVGTPDPLVSWTGRHLLDAGGKRVRPLLVLLAASFGDMTLPAVTQSAILVELTHLASLYHDDVMDSASTRRGVSSAHEVWGNSVAILTGDFLFARASGLSAALGADSVALHAQTFERLCLGQLNETVGPRDGEDPFEHYLAVLREKTASLIAACGEFGALNSGAPQECAQIMRRYGETVGVAFQLADDVLDLRSDPETSGKEPGTDLREGVPTMPTLLVRRRAQETGDPAAQEIVQLLDSDLSSKTALARAVTLLREDPSVDEAEALASKLAEESIQILQELPAGAGRDALESFTRRLVFRGR